ncbi:MAG: 30S ribosomal protein S6 [Elusimicrobia bacterium]|nr:30S ribosomal protein S6 [Elusimicrobiota bacterium]
MRLYETVLILKPVMTDQEVAELSDKTKASISGGGGEVLSQDNWGRRKLLHMIGKSREGVYLYFKYRASTALLEKLGHTFRVSDQVLRHSFTLMRERKVREKKPKKAKASAAA